VENGENLNLTVLSHDKIEAINEPFDNDGIKSKLQIATKILAHVIALTYFSFATYHYISTREIIFIYNH
jgi:hypothetical protein